MKKTILILFIALFVSCKNKSKEQKFNFLIISDQLERSITIFEKDRKAFQFKDFELKFTKDGNDVIWGCTLGCYFSTNISKIKVLDSKARNPNLINLKINYHDKEIFNQKIRI